MAESRYSTNKGSSATPTLDPNTQQSTGSMTSTQASSQFQGLLGQGATDIQNVINTLLHGAGQAVQGTVYRDKSGKVVSAEAYKAQQQEIASLSAPSGSYGGSIALAGRAQSARIAQRNAIYANLISPSTEPIDPKTGQPIGAADYEGTPAMQEAAVAKKQVMADLQKLIASYSPEGASADAALAMQGMLRKSLEENMPAIQRSIEGAGTSGGSMEALLSQDIATRAAETGAKLGLEAKRDYGQISSQLAQTLGQLSIQKDPVMEALLQALETNKIATQSSSQTQKETRQSGPIGLSGASSPQVFAPN